MHFYFSIVTNNSQDFMCKTRQSKRLLSNRHWFGAQNELEKKTMEKWLENMSFNCLITSPGIVCKLDQQIGKTKAIR